ncbi:MAG: D-alanyl-D-alanine carboxypeptidase [Acidimicrobiia bacterium]|nr:D-alanyl-D-alanine carboxypeptidase [Acidimicrobiia bacterium]
MEGIERVQSRIGDIESRIAAIHALVSGPAAVGWAPGLDGVGQPGPTGSTVGGYTTAGALTKVGGASDLLSGLNAGQSTSFAQTLAQMQGEDPTASGLPGSTALLDPSAVNTVNTLATGTTGLLTKAGLTTVDLNSRVNSATGLTNAPIPPFTPPAALVAYGNGHIPLSALAPIGVGTHRLWGPAAASFQRMNAEAAKAGVKIGATDSYRSYDQQVQLVQQKGLYSEGGLAAPPGQSKHGWGVALDVDVDSRGLAWLRANGARFGFYETTPREPWHWEYRTAS